MFKNEEIKKYLFNPETVLQNYIIIIKSLLNYFSGRKTFQAGGNWMELTEVIKTRKSVRTYDGRQLTEEDRQALEEYAKTITNPYGIPVSFVFLDAEKYGLSSNVIKGEHLYVAGKVPKTAHCEEAFGFSFEKLVLYAWSRGIGTTWIGGTMDPQIPGKRHWKQ